MTTLKNEHTWLGFEGGDGGCVENEPHMLVFEGGDGDDVGEEQLPSKMHIHGLVLRVEMMAANEGE